MSDKNRRIERFHYGICLNDECSKCRKKEIQQIPLRKELICEECGKPLRECTPPVKTATTKYIVLGMMVVVIGIVGVFLLNDNEKKVNEEKIIEEPVSQVDSVATDVQEIVEETAKITSEETEPVEDKVSEENNDVVPISVKSNGKIQLSYGSYTGDLKSGYPHGQGRLIYSTDRQINRYDMKKRTAKAGQYVIGEFERGFFIQGRLYSSDGELLEAIMIGTAPGNMYESK